MTVAAPAYREHGNAYNIFILVLTIFSLVLMVLPAPAARPADADPGRPPTTTSICVDLPDRFRDEPRGLAAEARVFHHASRLARPPWLDPDASGSSRSPRSSGWPGSVGLSGSPGSWAARTARRSSRTSWTTAAQYATFITILLAGMVLSVASILVLNAESRVARRQHQDRRRRHLVGHRDDHHRRLWRLLPGDHSRAHHRRIRHVLGHRHHRRAGQHPGEPVGHVADGAGARSRRRRRVGRRRHTGERHHAARGAGRGRSRASARSPPNWPACEPRSPVNVPRSRPCAPRSTRPTADGELTRRLPRAPPPTRNPARRRTRCTLTSRRRVEGRSGR